MNRPLKIYKSEVEAGLADKIIAASIVTADCDIIQFEENHPTSFPLLNHLQNVQAKQSNFDLYPLYTIMVSTGWNKNDDIFDRWEVFAARDTPEDKPFNLEHRPAEIIGHITGGWVVNDELEMVEAKTVEDLPDRIHLLTSAVVYKHIGSRDKEVKEKTKELIAEIAENKWFVSMEALFNNFDYGVILADGSQKVVARNEETAFLTKYLRSFGGDGVYNDKRIGRLLRNITFSGKGLTKKPANLASVIFNNIDIFKGVFATAAELNQVINTVQEVVVMADENEKVLKLERQNADAQNEIKALRDRLQKMDEEKVTAEINSLKDVIFQKDQAIADLNKKIDEITASYNEVAKKHEDLSAAKAEIDKSLVEAQSKLVEIEIASHKTNRVSSLVDRGVDKAEAERLVEKAGNMTDEQFQLLVDATSKKVESETPTETTADEEAETPEEMVATETNLGGVQEETASELNVNTTTASDETVDQLKGYFLTLINK